MSSTKQSPSASVLGGPLAKLVSAGSSVRHGVRRPNLKRWGLRLLAVVVALVVVWELFLVAVRIITTNMWFDSVGNGSVYRTLLEAQIVLFCVFGVIAGLVGGVTVVTVRRVRSPLYLSPETDTFRWTFRKYEPRFRRLIVLLAVVIPAVLVGRQAAAGARTYLLWRHAAPWGSTDPLFHKDISFFVEVFPFHRLVVTLLLQAVAYGLWIAVISGYWYGTWRLRRGRQKITRDFTTLISLLLAGYLVLKAGNYWLARYALTTSQRGPVTGASYADVHAALPSKYVLMSVALVCAAGLLASAFLRVRVRGLVAAVSLMVAAVLLAGVAWPSLLYHFREAPSAAKLDLGEIAHNQKATLDAFGLSGDVTTVPYNPSTSIQGTQLVSLAKKTAQVSLIDPNQLSPTWNVEQQLQAYYGFKSTLDNSPLPARRTFAGRRPGGPRTAVRRDPALQLGQPAPRLHPRLRHRRGPHDQGGLPDREPGVPRRWHPAVAGDPRQAAADLLRAGLHVTLVLDRGPAGRQPREPRVRPPRQQRLVPLRLHDLPRDTAGSRSGRPCGGSCSRSASAARTSSSARSSTRPRSCSWSAVRGPGWPRSLPG